MRSKTVALMVLLILTAGAFFVTSENHLAVDSDEPLTLTEFFTSLCRPAVALGDPVPGGGGGGGD